MGQTRMMPPPNDEFVSWQSADNLTYRLRVRTRVDGRLQVVPYVIAAAIMAAISEGIRGGDPQVVLDAFGNLLNLNDANGYAIWPVPKNLQQASWTFTPKETPSPAPAPWTPGPKEAA